MFRMIGLTALTLCIALGGGVASVWYALNTNESFGAVRVGPWTAYPAEGRPGTDPYSAARRARDAELPLGQAEGLAFYARSDGQGRALSGRCTYVLEGNVPAARFWTLHLADPSLVPLAPTGERPGGVHSRQILRRADSSFTVGIGPEPAPGNWIATPTTQPFIIVLTLFDTPVTSTVSASEQVYPQIVRTGCD